jgi:hypothetical protein
MGAGGGTGPNFKEFAGSWKYFNEDETGLEKIPASHSVGYDDGSICTCFHAGFLLGLFFDTEDGGNIFTEILVDFQQTMLHYIPGERTFQN